MDIEIHASIASIGCEAWNSLVGDASPFLEWEWLSSLEEAGCVRRETGWLPQHIAIREGGRLIAACPLYVKGHSQGEFVFDHGWADAARRAAIRYYPKLLVGVPFTPAAGHRILTAADTDRTALIRAVGEILSDICRRNRFSSVHVNFCRDDEIALLSEQAFHRRTGFQFQWRNRGWCDFDDYLQSFRSKRRVQIKRERRELLDQRVDIVALHGPAIPDDLFPRMFQFYKSTIDKLYWGQQYLNETLFDLLRQRWKHRLVFFVALRDGRPIAGTFTVRKGDALYGRYWGCVEELRYLHFNVCYYASIEYCLGQGLHRFEPGAGGDFKYLRGFDPHPTDSMHFIAEPRFERAIADHLARERAAVGDQIEWLQEHGPLKPGSSDPRGGSLP